MLSVIALITLVVSFTGSSIVGHILEKQIAKALEEKTPARVTFGFVLYAPPYSVYLHDVHVTMPREGTSEAQRFAAKSVSIRLDHFPRRGEPISIESVVVRNARINIGDHPQPVTLERVAMSVRQTAERTGFEGQLMVGDSLAGSVSADARFELESKQLRLGRVSGAFQIAPLLASLPLSQNANPSIDSSSLDGKVNLSGWAVLPLRDMDHADYQLTLNLEAVAANVARLKANLSDGKCSIVLRPSGISPSAVEARIETLSVASNHGRLSLDNGVAVVRPREKTWDLSHVVGTVAVGEELPLFLPKFGWYFNEGKFNGRMRFTLAAGGPFGLKGNNLFQAIRYEVLAYPRDFAVRPRNFVYPIEQINGGPISFRGGVVSFRNLSGIYGHDKLLLRNARLALDDPARQITIENLRNQVKFEEIAGTVIFDRASPPYPGVIGKTVSELQPEGPFAVGGGTWFAMIRPQGNEPSVKFKPDFCIKLAGDGGSFAVRPYDLPLTDIHGQVKIVPKSVDISGFYARSLGGQVWANGQVVLGRPFLYNGKIDIRDWDMAAVAQRLPLSDSVKARLSGTAGLSTRISGTGKGGPKTPTEALIADAEFEILHGDFWSVPTVKEVASHVHETKELGTGDAAGVVHIENDKIAIKNSAISSRLIGLQGHGTVGFDKSLDLTIVVAPLGDWRARMKQGGMHLVGNVVGGVQQVLNVAQRALVSEFKITGTFGNPQEEVIPVPIVTQPVAFLFGKMAGEEKNSDLLGEVERQAPETAARAEKNPPQPQPASAHQPAVK